MWVLHWRLVGGAIGGRAHQMHFKHTLNKPWSDLFIPLLSRDHKSAAVAEWWCSSHIHWLQPELWSSHEALSDSLLEESTATGNTSHNVFNMYFYLSFYNCTACHFVFANPTGNWKFNLASSLLCIFQIIWRQVSVWIWFDSNPLLTLTSFLEG